MWNYRIMLKIIRYRYGFLDLNWAFNILQNRTKNGKHHSNMPEEAPSRQVSFLIMKEAAGDGRGAKMIGERTYTCGLEQKKGPLM